MLNNQSDVRGNRPLLAIDFDDVLFDCDGALREILRREFGFNATYSEFIKTNPHMKEEVFRFLYGNDHQNCAAINGSREAVTHLLDAYRVIVITGRSETTMVQTEDWLRNNFATMLPEVYFANNFLSDPNRERRKKVEICIKLGVSVLVEDSLEEAVSVASDEITVLLIDKPWNRCELLPPNVYRVKDWKHILTKLLRASRK